jgi:hypothetical protein
MQNNPKLHLYGNSAAVTLEGTQKGALSTLNIDIAPKPDNHNVDWSQKITLQLSFDEMVCVAGVFLGYVPEFSCKRPSKGISFQRQPGKVFVSASSGAGHIYGIPLTIGDCVQCSDFILARISENCVGQSSDLLLASIKGALALSR